MKTFLRYECEICGTDYGTEAKALECEATGLPEPMPFLSWDKPVPVFGDGDVVWTTIRNVFVRRSYNRHEWWGHCIAYFRVSRDIEDYSVPMVAFDPRHGWDFFRYTDSPKDLAVWESTLASYGFTEADVNPYLRSHIQQIRVRHRRIEQMVSIIEKVDATDATISETPPFVEHSVLISAGDLVRHKSTPTVETG